jgi:putative ABC transport system permease protein
VLTEIWSDLRYRLRALVRRADLEAELEAELRHHLDREAEKYQAAGLPPEEARRRASIAFGGVDRTKEESRDARGLIFLETLWQDARYAVRTLRRSPVFTGGVVLTLGLGIGANAAMFGIIDRLLFRPPAYLRDPAHVHRVYVARTRDRREVVQHNLQVPRYLDFVRWTHALSSLAAFSTWQLAVGDGDAARPLPVTAATVNYFGFFDARPVLGRFFQTGEDSLPTGSPVAVLGYAFWQSEFGGKADAVGKQLRVGHTLYTIVGIAPERFTGMTDQGVPALYIPLTAFAWDLRGTSYLDNYGFYWLEIIVRRGAGVSISSATSDLTAAFQRSWLAALALDPRDASLASARPRAMLAPVQLSRGPEADAQAKVVVWIAGVALIVLLIACANVANLLLARGLTRRRETALRLALGVSRGRLTRQLLTESVLLAGGGGILGILIAQWGGSALRAIFLPSDLAGGIFGDTHALIIALVATIGTALLTGVAPALQAAYATLSGALNAGGRDAGARPSRARTTLMVFQAALSVVLLVGAGLFVRSLQKVRSLHLGYDVDPLIVVTENLRGLKLTPTEHIALESRLVDEARTITGAVSATPAASIWFWGYEGRALYVDGIDSVSTLGNFLLQAGNADYFRTTGTRIIRGRAFDRRDGADAPRVVVVSDGMAKVLWPNRDPLGRCIRISADTAPCTTVVGVAEEVRSQSLANRDEYTYYVPATQYLAPAGMLFVRVAGDAAEYADLVRRALQRIMPGSAYVTAVPFRTMVDPQMESWRSGATMFVVFGALALVLAGIGLYSQIAYGVAQRRREIGVRIALGATGAGIVALVVRGSVRVVIAGIIIGGLIAAVAGHWAESLLFRETPNDPLVYALVAAVLVAVAFVASAVPAHAAARVDPNVALRAD